jgi:hypothetical protein
MPKAIALVASVRSAVSCPLLPQWSRTLIFSKRSGGWMWQAERFVVAGELTGESKMLSYF